MRTTTPLKAGSSYFKLVKAFPLRTIRTLTEVEAANRVLVKLVMSKPKMNAGENQYIEAMTALIRQYESIHPELLLPPPAPLELLKHLMHETGMTPGDLGDLIGHQPTASQILSGKRELSKVHILKLADHFKLSTDAFMGRPIRNYRRAS